MPKSGFDFQHAPTKDANTRLKTLMGPAGAPEAEHGFRTHGARTAKALVELEQGTDTATLNKPLGWVPVSKQWQACGRPRQMSALLTDSRRRPGSHRQDCPRRAAPRPGPGNSDCDPALSDER